MSESIWEFLVNARKEAERKLYDLDKRIETLRRELSEAEEQRLMFNYIISDLRQKLHTVQSAKAQSRPVGNAFSPALLAPTHEIGAGLFGFARNAFTHSPHGDDRRRPTMKEMIFSALNVVPEGLDVNDLIDFIQAAFDVEVARTSLSPQLSRMKAEGVLELAGDVWRLKFEDNEVSAD